MTEPSFIDFRCPYCSEGLSFPTDYIGLAQECPLCGGSLIVPEAGSELGRPVPLPIDTPRLLLRRLQPSDWKDLLEFASDEALFQYLDVRPMMEEEVLHWLEADSHVKLTTPNTPFYLGMEERGSTKLIGHLSLSFSVLHAPQAMLSFLVNRNYQRKGFASEALSAMLSFCFQGIGLHRVTAYCDHRHVAARRIFAKAGFRQEGEFVQDRFLNGEWVTTVYFGFLREAYRPTSHDLVPK
jgi:[ribosomal protein S5]-alanine N-acetyltransferase